VAQVLEIGLAADQIASAVVIFPGAVAAIAMPSAEAHVVTTDPALGQGAAEAHQVLVLVAVEEAAVAVVDEGKG
jgi:hypothetical protein